jgi:FMN phosphatase YigB (HAD superfamily)
VSKFDDVRMGTKKYFNFLLKKYKILANECLFVDDKDKNCKVADVV